MIFKSVEWGLNPIAGSPMRYSKKYNDSFMAESCPLASTSLSGLSQYCKTLLSHTAA